VKFLIDENISKKVALALRALDEDVHHVTELLHEGAKDEDVLRFAGENDMYIITRDERIRYKPNEKAAIRDHGMGVFLLAGKNKSALELARQLIWNWEKIKGCAQQTHRPFIRRIRSRGERIEEVPLG